MFYKDFRGNSISALGLGCLRFPLVEGDPNQIDRAKAREIVETAIENGVNYFDTAYTYQNGDSERFLGEILQQYPRDSYYLTSKFYVGAGVNIVKAFEEQLERCHTDYFDFYLLHGFDQKNCKAYMDMEKDYMGFIRTQQRLGRIRYTGFSSHAEPELLKELLAWYPDFDMGLIQLNYLDYELLRAKEQYEILCEHGLGVWVMEPLKGGRLAQLNATAADLLRGAAPDRSLASWGMRFVMSLPKIQTILSGMSSLEQLLDNLKTFSAPDPLSDEELTLLRQAGNAYLKDMGVPCSECRYCCSHCPAELDIPLLLRGYNELRVTGDTWRIPSLQNTRSAESCLQCASCTEHCPQQIDIPAVMAALKELTKNKEKKA